MTHIQPTYAAAAHVPPHWSFFRQRLARRARPVPEGSDPVHEYLVEQANLRGFLGAWTTRGDLGDLDLDLGLEDIVVGLLQPHAPAEGRIVKLIVRMIQSNRLDLDRLGLAARRERADANLAWVVELVPEAERTAPIEDLACRLRARPPRGRERPDLRYDPQRLLRRAAGR